MIKLAALFVIATAANVVAAPEVASAPQTWEYLSIQNMTENFGFPFSVLVLAALGSLIGAWNQQQDSRKGLTITFLSSTVLAIGASVLGPYLLKFSWPNSGIHATAAMVLGFTAQNWGPELIKAVGPAIKQYLRRLLPLKESDR